MKRRIITCDSCGHNRERGGYKWCRTCYTRWDRAGRPAAGPPPVRNGRYDEYRELTRDHHYTRENAVARMGISLRTAERYEARLAAAGVPAATYQSGRFGVLATRPGALASTRGQEAA